MEWNNWQKYYKEILNNFGFSKEDDENSAKLLSSILEDVNCLNFDDLLKALKSSKKFIVFGAGPSLLKHIQTIKKWDDFEDYIFVSADGATSALLSENIIPDIIVTDLDGKIEDLFESNKKGSLMVIHAHGNNYDELKKYVKKFNNVLGTTQSKPLENLYNFGGFTDGDRAIFLSVALGANEIVLAGMDFGNIITKFSRPNISKDIDFADEIKEKKLKYAEELTRWIIENENVKITKLK